MKKVFLIIFALLISISAYSQSNSLKRTRTGKQNTVRALHKGNRDGHVPTEGDGTGDKIMGEKTKRLKDLYAEFIGQRKNFATRRYHLRTSGGEPIKTGR